VGKPKGDHTPEHPPLDDDQRWLPIDAARQRRVEQTGDAGLVDLTDALAQGSLRCMIRSTAGERKRVAATAWRYQLILSSEKDGLRVLRRHPDIVKPVGGWVFFIWEPDLDRLPPGGARARS
jgi:hypothetical protein